MDSAEVNATQFVFVKGKKYVLAEDQSDTDLSVAELPEKWQNLQPPPRMLPLSVWFGLHTGSYSPIFIVLFGWFFACFGMLFCAVFLPQSLPEQLHWQYEPCGEGKIISVEKTNMTVGDSSIYKIRFKQPDGTEGNSYSVRNSFKEGDEVPLEKSGNAVRIKGTKITSFGRLAAFVLLFPLVGIGMVCVCGFLGRKTYLFLRDGEVTAGQFIDMKPTGVEINGCLEMKLRYRIITADGETAETYVKALDTDKAADNPVEPLLYNPLKPQNALALNELPRGVWYDETDGSFNVHLMRCVLSILFLAVFIAEFVFMVYAFQIGGLEIGSFGGAD